MCLAPAPKKNKVCWKGTLPPMGFLFNHINKSCFTNDKKTNFIVSSIILPSIAVASIRLCSSLQDNTTFLTINEHAINQIRVQCDKLPSRYHFPHVTDRLYCCPYQVQPNRYPHLHTFSRPLFDR